MDNKFSRSINFACALVDERMDNRYNIDTYYFTGPYPEMALSVIIYHKECYLINLNGS